MLKSFSYLVLATAISGLYGCSGSKSKSDDGLTFTNDMETILAWTDDTPANIVYFNNAHSGKYVNLIDSSHVFGSTFQMRNKDVSTTLLKKVTFGAWFNSQQNGSQPELVIDLHDKNGNSIEWISESVKDKIKTQGKWTWAEFSIDLVAKKRNDPENSLRIYAINKSGSVCLVDDMQVSYEK